MSIYVARQPIFSAKKRLHAYELLFRDGRANAFPPINGETATAKLLSDSFFNIGMRQLTGGRRAFINFTEDLLLKQVPLLFPAQDMMVEILETVPPTPEVLTACRRIKAAGYRLALDDFVFQPGLDSLLPLANVIKIDFRLLSLDAIGDMVGRLKGFKAKLLAEKIETHTEFEAARRMGFAYFQGYFFSRPEVIESRDIPASKLQLLQIMGEIQNADFDLGKLEALINRDVSVAYKLLRYINSAYFRRVREVQTLRHAIALLGQRELKKFLSLIAAAELASNKPLELIRASIVRAKFCELLGAACRPADDPAEYFVLGLFSLIDAMLNRDMASIMVTLPLAEPIKEALVHRRGAMADVLRLGICYESGRWEYFPALVRRLKVAETSLPAFYEEALGWADAYPAGNA